MGIFIRVALSAVLVLIAFSESEARDLEAVPGEYLIKIKEAARSVDPQLIERSLVGQVLRSIPDQRIFVIKRPVVELTRSVIYSLSQNPYVEIAEPNYIYHAEKLPNDVDFGKLWGLRNIGQADSKTPGVPGIDIDAEKAWDLTTGSDDVVVAVIDTGVDYTHPELKDNMWINEAEQSGQPGVDDDGNGYVDDVYGYNFSDPEAPLSDPLDDNGHGSHCAGTIGGRGDNDAGIVGVNWKVKIMPIKFLGAAGGGTLEGAILAIDYATKMKAKILNNSWGGGGESVLLKDAIQRSADAGALFVAAAGNDGWSTDDYPHFPSGYPVDNIISVGAIDNHGDLAGFSNFGKRSVDVAAPGQNIYSSFVAGSYQWLSGTSMATPHVSGIAALLLAYDSNLSAAELKKRLISTVRILPSLRYKVASRGAVNAFYALTNYQSPPDMTDPFFWDAKIVNISNFVHPYAKNAQETFDVEILGAKEFALYFEKFEMERDFDKIQFYDRAGNLLFKMTGYQSDTYSPTIAGDWVRLVFTSDKSVEKYGFDLTKISFR